MGFILAIDGPAGAGKSTVARLTAGRLGFVLVDTGAIYRSVALKATRSGVEWSDEPGLSRLAAEVRLEFRLVEGKNRVFLDGEDVSEAIRSPEMSRGAAAVATLPAVRGALLELQRRLAQEDPSGAVLEGRDIGTVVFPEAPVKVFLTASPEERARRRHEELLARGLPSTYHAVLADQIARDAADQGREIAPLKPAEDAVRVDTTGRSVDQVVEAIVSLVDKAREAR